MDKKFILVSGVMAGILVAYIPTMYLDGILSLIIKIIGYMIMFVAVVYFVAGETIMSKFQNKEINKMIKEKKITPEQVFALEMKKLDVELQKEKQKLEIAKVKAQIQNTKVQASQGSKQDGFKFPNVLENISPILGSGQSKEKEKARLNRLNDFMLKK